jgi:hypothetical protein
MVIRIIRRLATAWLLATGVTLLPLLCSAAESLYHFVDENGVSHFSNVPADARYRPIGPSGGSAPSAAVDARRPGAARVAPPHDVPEVAQPYDVPADAQPHEVPADAQPYDVPAVAEPYDVPAAAHPSPELDEIPLPGSGETEDVGPSSDDS